MNFSCDMLIKQIQNFWPDLTSSEFIYFNTNYYQIFSSFSKWLSEFKRLVCCFVIINHQIEHWSWQNDIFVNISPGNNLLPVINDSQIFIELSQNWCILSEVYSSVSEIDLTDGQFSRNLRPFVCVLELIILPIRLSVISLCINSGLICQWLFGKEPNIKFKL